MAHTKEELQTIINTLLADAKPIRATDHRGVDLAVVDEMYDAQSRGNLLAGVQGDTGLVDGDTVLVIRSGEIYKIPRTAFGSAVNLTDLEDVEIVKATTPDFALVYFDFDDAVFKAALFADLPIALNGAQVRDALQTLTGVDRLDASAIKNIPATGVITVTGDGVDNTDPDNPVLSFPEAPEVIFTPAGNISATNVGGALQELDGEKQAITEKGAANGYASLGSDGKVPSGQLPSYVDDIIEAANFAALPVTGEVSKIYITLDNNNQYRWGGSSYVQILSSPGSTDAVPEGSTNLYFTVARVRATLLTGLSVLTNAAILATDTILEALGKLQAQITATIAAIPVAADQTETDAGTNTTKWINALRLFGKFKAKTTTSTAFNVDATNDLKTIIASPSGPINATINAASTDVIVCVENHGSGTITFVNGTATFAGISSLLPNRGAKIRYTAAGTAVIIGGSTITFANVTAKPTTVAGYGITDASRAIFATGTTVTTAGTTETTIATGNIPANTLGTDLGHLRAVFVGQIGVSAPNKTLKVKLGATTIFDSGLIPIAGAVDFEIQIKIMRTASNAQRGSVTLYSNSGTVAGVKYFTAAEDLTTLLALAVTGKVETPGGTEVSGTMFYAVKEGI